MKVVLDTNVLLSGLVIGTAAPATIITMWEDGVFELSVSEHILDGVARALGKPYWQQRLDLHPIEERLSRVRRAVDLKDPVTDVHGVAEDDEDDLVLATAVAAQADYLVTGDKYLLRIAEFRGIPIVSPRDFLDLMLAQDRGRRPRWHPIGFRSDHAGGHKGLPYQRGQVANGYVTAGSHSWRGMARHSSASRSKTTKLSSVPLLG